MKYLLRQGVANTDFEGCEQHDFTDLNGYRLTLKTRPIRHGAPYRDVSGITICELIEDHRGSRMQIKWLCNQTRDAHNARRMKALIKDCLFIPKKHESVTEANHPSLWFEDCNEHLFYFQSPDGKLRAISVYHTRSGTAGARRPAAIIRVPWQRIIRVTATFEQRYVDPNNPTER